MMGIEMSEDNLTKTQLKRIADAEASIGSKKRVKGTSFTEAKILGVKPRIEMKKLFIEYVVEIQEIQNPDGSPYRTTMPGTSLLKIK